MELEHSFIDKEENMLDNGNKIKWMEKVHFFILMIKLLMKVIGKMISCMVMEYYLINK
jgi:hypothetical protein